uniref:Uncharacterized protein n=1 Tax=Rhizophora mucronata TaxID=61149 RepID=A0A2P2QWA7_RHIMU
MASNANSRKTKPQGFKMESNCFHMVTGVLCCEPKTNFEQLKI